MNCPNCGRKKISQMSDREVIISAIGELAGKNEKFCECSADVPEPVFWKANKITAKQAEKMGDLALRTRQIHHRPDMRDCRDLDYGYYINPQNRVICEACGDYFDITDSILG